MMTIKEPSMQSLCATRLRLSDQAKASLLDHDDAIIGLFLGRHVTSGESRTGISREIDEILSGYSIRDIQDAIDGLNVLSTKQRAEQEDNLCGTDEREN